jgi:hypothetical protein
MGLIGIDDNGVEFAIIIVTDCQWVCSVKTTFERDSESLVTERSFAVPAILLVGATLVAA